MATIKVGVSQPNNDYAGNMKKISKGRKQAVPMEPGNNGTIRTSKGKADFGDGSYASSLKKSQ